MSDTTKNPRTLEEVRDWHRKEAAFRRGFDPNNSMIHKHDEMADAINAHIAAQREGVPPGWVILPRELTAENGAKHALIGEIPCHIDGIRVAVPWTSIKEVHKAVVRLFEGKAPISSMGTPPRTGA